MQGIGREDREIQYSDAATGHCLRPAAILLAPVMSSQQEQGPTTKTSQQLNDRLHPPFVIGQLGQETQPDEKGHDANP